MEYTEKQLNINISNNILDLKEAHEWTDQQIATKAGMHANIVAKARNEGTCSLKTLAGLANAFNVDPSYFLKEVEFE